MPRKSIYKEVILDHIEDIGEMAKNGCTDKQIYENLGISHQTWSRFLKEKSELSETIKKSRAIMIKDVKNALLKKALGYEYQEKKQSIRKTDAGDVVFTEIYTKKQHPSEAAINMILKNYDETWSENDTISKKFREQELKLKQEIAKDKSFNILDL